MSHLLDYKKPEEADRVFLADIGYGVEEDAGKILPYNIHSLHHLFHLAGEAVPRQVASHPDLTMDFAVSAVKDLVEKACIHQGIKPEDLNL